MFQYISQKNYEKAIEWFPMLTVDLIIWKNNEFLLTLRKISPYKGKWHTPGGIVRKGETISKAIDRIAKNELSSKISKCKFIGVYENPRKFRHDISLAYVCKISNYDFKSDFQTSSIKLFKKIPNNIIPFQKQMIIDSRSLKDSI